MGQKENGTSVGKVILGGIFLLWFIASMIGMYVCSQVDGGAGLMLVILGQFFLVFGIIGIAGNIKKKPFPIIIILFPLAGSALIVWGLSLYMGSEHLLEMLGNAVPYLAVWLFPVIGVILVADTVVRQNYLKRVCTYKIQAKCISVEREWSKGTRNSRGDWVYMPVYSIMHSGREMNVSNGVYTNLNNLKVGEYYYIKINPLNPQEFIDENSRKGNKLSLVLGIIFILLAIPAIILMKTGIV